jgi:molybdopterin-guanine dinucleotide biosynthesis protein A
VDRANRDLGWTVIVVSGGQGRRLGGVDKSGILIGGVPALDLLIGDLPADVPVIVAGRPRPCVRSVLFRPESPLGGGPVAGIAAALPYVTTEWVALVAVDMPRAGALVVELAGAFDGGTDAIIPLDADERRQPLCSVWATDALRRALHRLGDPRDRSMNELLEGATLTERRLPSHAISLLADIDTRDDLVRARQREGGPTLDEAEEEREVQTMDEWIDALRLEFDLDVPVDVVAILDVARVAAHNVARPAAPVTTFLLGLAVARGADITAAANTITALAEGWTPPE